MLSRKLIVGQFRVEVAVQPEHPAKAQSRADYTTPQGAHSRRVSLPLATLRPTALIDVFKTPALRAVAQEVEEVLVQMMNEAA